MTVPPDILKAFIEGKLTDALRSVSANQTFMSLHSQRKEFAEMIQAALSEELKKNGKVEPKYEPSATILFADFKGFTLLAERMEPVALIGLTGQTGGPHVHWEVKSNGRIVNPLDQ